MTNLKKTVLKMIMIIIVLLSVSFIYAHADDTNMGRTPDGVFPMNESDIVMESEDITVDLEKNKVECIFVFRNTGKEKSVLMGFPGKISSDQANGLTDEVDLEIHKFKAFINKKQVPVIHEKTDKSIAHDLKYSEYYTFTVPFKANEKITVRNTYEFTPPYDSISNVFSGYVLKTGAMWKDTIGFARVTFKLGSIKPYQFERLSPGGFRFKGNSIVWERSNFEPEYDLYLYYNTWHYQKDYVEDKFAPTEEITRIKQKIEKFREIKKIGNKGEVEKLIDLYKKAIAENDSAVAAYIAGFIPTELPEIKPIPGDIKINKYPEGYSVFCETSGAEIASSQSTISHVENGAEIVDAQYNNTGIEFKFAPGIEYKITFTFKDWLGRTTDKTMKYTVPTEIEAAATVEQTSVSVQTEVKEETVNSVQVESDKQNTVNNNDKISKYTLTVVCVSGGLVLAVVSIFIVLRRKKS